MQWLCLLTPALFFGFLGWLSWSVRRSLQRDLARLGARSCPSCSVKIDAVYAHATAMAEKQKEHERAREEGVMLRMSPEWSFPCNGCKAPLQFDPESGALTVRG